MALSTVSRDPHRAGDGQARSDRARAAVSATSARGPASSSTSTSRSSVASRAAPASASSTVLAALHATIEMPRASDAARSAGSTSTSPSTTTADSPTPRCSPTRRPNRDRLPPPSPRLLRPLRDQDRAGAHRQRLCLPLANPCARLPRAGHPPPPNTPLPPANERQSRTLHPHTPRRLGLRRRLRLMHRTSTALDGWLGYYNHRRRHYAKDVLVEVRQAAGDEAALWGGAKVYGMVRAVRGAPGYKLRSRRARTMVRLQEVTFAVKGDALTPVFSGGGRRVQRVPQTESQGRIHMLIRDGRGHAGGRRSGDRDRSE